MSGRDDLVVGRGGINSTKTDRNQTNFPRVLMRVTRIPGRPFQNPAKAAGCSSLQFGVLTLCINTSKQSSLKLVEKAQQTDWAWNKPKYWNSFKGINPDPLWRVSLHLEAWGTNKELQMYVQIRNTNAVWGRKWNIIFLDFCFTIWYK